MIKSIKVKNFKSLNVPFELPLRNILLLVGPNSSGKSSLLQAILMLKQTIDSRDMENPLLLNGKYVSLGSFEDIIFRHDLDKDLEIELKISSHRLRRSAAVYLRQRYIVTKGQMQVRPRHRISEKSLVEFEYEYGFNPLSVETINIKVSFRYDQKRKRIFVDSYQAGTNIGNNEIIFFKIYEDGKKVEIPLLKFTENQHKNIQKRLRRGKFYYNFRPDIYEATFRATLKKAFFNYITDLSYSIPTVLDEEFSKVFYLGPLREYPQRYYIASGETPIDVGLRGESVIDIIFKDLHYPESVVAERLAYWFKKFDLAFNIKLEPIASNLNRLIVYDSYTKIPVNISDIGFGASQVLPFIVEGFHSPKNSIIISEQPEIHLHPKVQAELADLMLDIIRRGKFLIIETHSEHIILRLQRRIAEKSIDIDNSKLNIFYFQETENGTKVEQIRLNEFGQFLNWPDGFFEEDLNESHEFFVALNKAQKNKQ